MLFLIFNLVILLVVIPFLLVILSMLWPPDSPWSPWWTTKPEIARKMCQLAGVNSKSLIYDLGCGTGTALVVAAREFGATGVGIEIDPLRFLNAKWNFWRFKVNKKIKLIRANFFSVSLAPSTVLFIYLIPKALKALTPKFLQELKSGTILISYVYPMPIELFKGKLKLVKEDKQNKILVYKYS